MSTQTTAAQQGIAVSSEITAGGLRVNHAEASIDVARLGRRTAAASMAARRSFAAAVVLAAVAGLAPSAAFAQSAPSPGQVPPITAPQPAPQPPDPPAPDATPPIAVPTPTPELTPMPPVFGAPQADTARLATNIRTAVAGNVFGWQFAITQDGKFVTAEAGGSARSSADNGGTRLAMKPTMRYELASVTKNVTALTTMKLLRKLDMNVDDPIDPYLPASWQRGSGFDTKSVTFRHLLAHSSGFGQRIADLSKKAEAGDEAAAATLAKVGTSWDGVKAHVELGAAPGSDWVYENANYALLRVLNGRMWYAAGRRLKTTETIEIENQHGAVKKKTITVTIAPDKAGHSAYAVDFYRTQIFAPIGIQNAGCTASSAAPTGLSYPQGATQSAKGALAFWPSNQCAGNAGLRLSSIELVRYLAHLRHGTIVHAADRQAMDAGMLGWNRRPAAGALAHGGVLRGAGNIRTCAVAFADGTEVSIIINSPPATHPCDIAGAAWQGAL